MTRRTANEKTRRAGRPREQIAKLTILEILGGAKPLREFLLNKRRVSDTVGGLYRPVPRDDGGHAVLESPISRPYL